MEYNRAKKEDLDQIYQLVQDTIQTVYPHYYPREIVDFFSDLHARENIAADIESGCVRVLFSENCLIGTGTFSENHISRLFVLPNFQQNGYGSYMMQRLEEEISAKHNVAILDASLCAACFYEHKGYKTVSHKEVSTDNGFYLVYEIMEKTLTS
ncbi:MAG: GNAT family N-acetyltransferase [Lachnospiraceae bacterium]|nr:GNAT family N-acetyltransferase [Lachnospiraceae bacterium]